MSIKLQILTEYVCRIIKKTWIKWKLAEFGFFLNLKRNFNNINMYYKTRMRTKCTGLKIKSPEIVCLKYL